MSSAHAHPPQPTSAHCTMLHHTAPHCNTAWILLIFLTHREHAQWRVQWLCSRVMTHFCAEKATRVRWGTWQTCTDKERTDYSHASWHTLVQQALDRGRDKGTVRRGAQQTCTHDSLTIPTNHNTLFDTVYNEAHDRDMLSWRTLWL